MIYTHDFFSLSMISHLCMVQYITVFCSILLVEKYSIVQAIIASESCSVASESLRPHGPCNPWNSPGQNTGVGSLSLLQGIFPNQGSNPSLPHCRWILYQQSHKGGPFHCTDIPYFVYHFIIDKCFHCFHFLAIVSNATALLKLFNIFMLLLLLLLLSRFSRV